MLRAIRSLPLLISLALLSACNFGGKDNASDSMPTPAPQTQPQRGALLSKPPTLLASYSTGDLQHCSRRSAMRSSWAG
jgi:hypothetical protein